MEIPQPDLAEPNDNAYYCNECEEEHARMTHVLDKCIPKPALKFWAEKVGRESMYEVMCGVQPSSSEVESLQVADLEAAVQIVKERGLDTESLSQVAMDRGTRVHNYLEWVGKGSPGGSPDPGIPRLDDDMLAYVGQFRKFIEAYAPEFHATEFKVAHHELGYAGTVDALATITKQPPRRNRGYDLTGKTVFIDYKTNKAGKVYSPSHPYQLNGYMHGYKDRRNLGVYSVMPDYGLVVAIGEDSYSTKVVEYEPEKIEHLMAFYGDLNG